MRGSPSQLRQFSARQSRTHSAIANAKGPPSLVLQRRGNTPLPGPHHHPLRRRLYPPASGLRHARARTHDRIGVVATPQALRAASHLPRIPSFVLSSCLALTHELRRHELSCHFCTCRRRAEPAAASACRSEPASRACPVVSRRYPRPACSSRRASDQRLRPTSAEAFATVKVSFSRLLVSVTSRLSRPTSSFAIYGTPSGRLAPCRFLG